MDGLRIGSLFTGYGGLTMATEQVFGGTTAWVSDIEQRDKKGALIGNAPLILEHRFPGVPNLGDITAVDWSRVEPVDIIDGGSPCFAADTPVLTARGYVPIYAVRVGDVVLTHENQWRHVTDTMNRIADTVEFSPGFYATPNHRFWARPDGREWRNETRRYRRVLGAPKWVEIEQAQGSFLAQPISVPSIAEPPSIPAGITYWHLGRWLADGYIGAGGQPVIAVGKQKFDRDTHLFDDRHWRVSEERTAFKFHYRDGSAGSWFSAHFGEHADGKTIPAWIFSASEQLRREFLAGYWSGDGYTFGKQSMRSASVSPCLTVGIRTLAESLGYTTSLHYNRVEPKKVIEGRVVNQRDWWSVTSTPDGGRYTSTIGNHRWSKLRKQPLRSGLRRVYDLTVEGDHSFIAAGFVVHNCQDVSAAGARAGITEGTRSNLWVAMREAIAQLKPAIVTWENVYGALSARADSRVESEPGLLGGGPGGPALRAAGRVCGDLASLGFDSEWAVVRASDVGAPHQRARVFIVAAHPERIDRIWGRIGPGSAEAEGACASTARCDQAPVRLLPTPAASQYGSNRSLSPGAAVRPSLAAIDKLLPTPNAAKAANDLTLTKSGDGRDNPNKLGWAVALLPTPRATRGGSGTETVNLLPTPTTQPETGNGHARNLGSEARHQFGDYSAAITRWEQVNGPAPDPTEGGRLSARFVEWLMGLPAGWVVDVPGLTRNQQLHALGNGVVPQQAAFAIRMLLTRLALQEAS